MRHPAQLEYFVGDVVEAARRHSAIFGSGPFSKPEQDIPLTNVWYRGRAVELSTTATFGYWGEVNILFVQKNTPGESIHTELHPDGSQGLHSVALMADEVDAEIARFAADGIELALTADVGVYGNFKLIYLDTVDQYGHFIKLLPKSDAITVAFEKFRLAQERFTGGDPFQSPEDLMA